VYIDGVISVAPGYAYDGRRNLPKDKGQAARLNARIQNRYCRILKQENPWFGTWYNFSALVIEWMRRVGGSDALLGAGAGDDGGNAWIRAMNNWKNVSCLLEWQTTLHQGEGPDRHPRDCFGLLCKNRDYIVQTYGGNVILGYLQGGPIEQLSGAKPPGPSKWGWPTVNYFLGQITATQHHLVLAVAPSPSLEPAFQFQTRYSRFLWAPDIKLVPEAAQVVRVQPDGELLWKPVVYRRATRAGDDLIVHLVRIPPTDRWDLNWVDEPAPLTGVEVSVDIGRRAVGPAYACRPYQFEEPQQVVQEALPTTVAAGRATVTVPPFRYYTMVVIHVGPQ
jgi:hypothetical protein